MRFWYQILGKLGGLFVLYTSKAFCFPLYLFDIIVHAVNMHYFYNKHVDQTVSIFFSQKQQYVTVRLVLLVCGQLHGVGTAFVADKWTRSV